MRLVPIYQTPNTSKKRPQHKVTPYLLKGLAVTRPSQVWCVDISYIPMHRGFLYLVTIMDWFNRKGLALRLSKSMEADFYVETLKAALTKYGPPEIMNSDRGSQFTGCEWADTLTEAGVKISMNCRGRWIDNRMIKRLWRSVKYK
ncbi:DDE-type integrase/transposase/recombinase [Thioclava sp. GXIMD2076]|uniref:DDE-type integrase/transposase/recombinase n=1 Tax=Thioclava sp. GXIMD2076 TaxID=3131931 RepID=UPI0030CE399A